MDYSEYFGGILRFNTLFLCINTALIIQFFFSWYLSYKRTGWTIDFWHVTLFLSYFVTFLLMYPFSTARLNMEVIGPHNLNIARKAINGAYIISLIGYLSIFAGGAIFRYYKYNTPIYQFLIKPVKSTMGELFGKIVVNRRVTRLVSFSYFLGLAFCLFLAFKAGMLNDPRGFYAKNGQIRFIFNFVNSLSGIVSGFLLTRIWQFNKRSDKLLFVLFIMFTVMIGSRGGVIGPILGFLTSFVYYRMQGRVKIGKIILVCIGMLLLIVGLSFFRAGSVSADILMDNFLVQIFYGNSFSDLRDFSWVLALWNGEYFYGKTYLAAFMSFIPSSFSHFRTEWSIGKVTAIMAGYNPKEHPGLRPGMFGESYLNFGIVGVIILGILIGYSWKYIDYKIKISAYSDNKVEAAAAGIGTMIIGSLPITAGFFGIYVAFVVYICLYIFRLFLNAYKKTYA